MSDNELMALHNYIYLKHKGQDPSCHKFIARDHDPKPELVRQSVRQERDPGQNSGGTGKEKKECCGKCTGKCTDTTSW